MEILVLVADVRELFDFREFCVRQCMFFDNTLSLFVSQSFSPFLSMDGKNETGRNKIKAHYSESSKFLSITLPGGESCVGKSVETIREVVCTSVPEVASKHTYLEAKQSPATRE